MSEQQDRLFGGIDIGGTKILAIVATEKGKVLCQAKAKAKGAKGFQTVCERAAETLREACAEKGVPLEKLTAIGVGAPSPILPNGRAVAAANLGWRNVPLTDTLSGLLGRPVYAENDCNAGTFGEYVYGAGKGAKTLMGLFMGTGLGGGIVFHGELITGENHMASELGHMIVQAGGRACGCGRQGCLEAYASKAGMGRRFAYEIACLGRKSALAEINPQGQYTNLRSSILEELYKDGDDLVVETLHEAADYLGLGIANYIIIFGPDMVVLGGGVMESLGDVLLPRIKEATKTNVWPEPTFKDTKIVLAKLGDHAVALGAIAYARQRLDKLAPGEAKAAPNAKPAAKIDKKRANCPFCHGAKCTGECKSKKRKS